MPDEDTGMNLRQRIRWFLAALAMLVAMWVAVDLHQHDAGWHTLASCSLCVLENAVVHGFAPQSDHPVTVELAADTTASGISRPVPFQMAQACPIRAPPVL